MNRTSCEIANEIKEIISNARDGCVKVKPLVNFPLYSFSSKIPDNRKEVYSPHINIMIVRIPVDL